MASLGIAALGVLAWPLEWLVLGRALPPGLLVGSLIAAVGLTLGTGSAISLAAGALLGLPLAHAPRLLAAIVVVVDLLVTTEAVRHGRRQSISVTPRRIRDLVWLLAVTGLLAAATGVVTALHAALSGGHVLRAGAVSLGGVCMALFITAGVAGLRDWVVSPQERRLETSLVTAAIAAAAALDFYTRLPPFLLAAPLLIYAAVRLLNVAVRVGLLISIGAALAATAHHESIYSARDVGAATALFGVVGAVVAMLGLSLIATLLERDEHAGRLTHLLEALQDGVIELDAKGAILRANASLLRYVGLTTSELHRRAPPYPFVSADEEGAPALDQLLAAARRDGVARGPCVLISGGGVPSPVTCTAVAAHDPEPGEAAMTVVFTDVSSVDRSARRQQALSALIAQAETERNPERLQTLVVESLGVALASAGAVVLALEPPGNLVVTASTWPVLPVGRRFALEDTVAGAALAAGRGLLVSGVEHGDHGPWRGTMVTLGLRSAVVAPMRVGAEQWGVLSVLATKPECFDEADVPFVEAAAHVLARAISAAASDLIDPATGLPNRRGLTRLIDEADTQCTVLAAELNLRALVDSLGYEWAEEAIGAAVERLRNWAGQGTLGRVAVDAVVLVHPELDADQARSLGRGMHDDLTAPLRVRGHELVMAVSVGVARATGGDGAEALRDALIAARAARQRGDAVTVFEPSIRTAAIARLRLEADLRRAVADGDIDVHFQPIAMAEDRKTVAFEALARWTTPHGQRVEPSEFIPLAEESDLIRPLGRHVLGRACEELARWTELRGDGFLSVTVNMSARELGAPDLVSAVEEAIARTGIEAQQLSLELTETVLLRETPAARAQLAALRDMGVWLILDDFGTGFASLSMLKRVVPKVVKLDRMFVAGADRVDEAIVGSTVAIATELGAYVVAEGVETEAQLARVRALGCRYAQGFLISPALPPEDVLELLRAELPAVAGGQTPISQGFYG